MLKKGICVALMIVMIFPMIFSQEVNKTVEPLSNEAILESSSMLKDQLQGEFDGVKMAREKTNKFVPGLTALSYSFCLPFASNLFLDVITAFPIASLMSLTSWWGLAMLSETGTSDVDKIVDVNKSLAYKSGFKKGYSEEANKVESEGVMTGGGIGFVLTFSLFFTLALISYLGTL